MFFLDTTDISAKQYATEFCIIFSNVSAYAWMILSFMSIKDKAHDSGPDLHEHNSLQDDEKELLPARTG